jgi:hypothetical protein
LLATSFGIALGLVLIIYGLSAATTGRDAQRLPDEIESVNPGDGDQVLRQAKIVVDFVTGYEGVLVIDGIELPTVRLDELGAVGGGQPQPGEQVVVPPVAVFDPGNSTIGFQPAPGAPIERFAQGEHTAAIVYWKSEDGRESARTYRWRFTVT